MQKNCSEEEKHAAKLASMTAQHEHYLREQSRNAVESASAAAAQAAAQFDATISERERAVAAAEAQIQMRRDEIEREGTRMTEMLRCAENDSATAAKQLKSLEERLTAMEKAEASIMSRRLEHDETKLKSAPTLVKMVKEQSRSLLLRTTRDSLPFLTPQKIGRDVKLMIFRNWATTKQEINS